MVAKPVLLTCFRSCMHVCPQPFLEGPAARSCPPLPPSWHSRATRLAPVALTHPAATSRDVLQQLPSQARSRPRRSALRNRLSVRTPTQVVKPPWLRVRWPLALASFWHRPLLLLRRRVLCLLRALGPRSGMSAHGQELVDQLSRLRPDTRDRIARLCARMGSPPGPGPAAAKPKSLFPPACPAVQTPKSSFPLATPAPAVPEIRAPPAPLDELGFPPEVTSDSSVPKAQAKASFPSARPTVIHPPPCLVQCPTPGCYNQCGRPVYGRGHRNHLCRVCHRLRG